MANIYYSGLSSSKLINDGESNEPINLVIIDGFTPLPWKNVTDIEIGWDYFLLWKEDELRIVGKCVNPSSGKINQSLQLPDDVNSNFKQAIAGSENITVLSCGDDVWIYNIHNGNWKKVPNFISIADEDKKECIVKIAQGRCTVALTNLGQVFNIPISLNDPELLEFIDVACGYDHTLLLARNGDVYSVGMGTSTSRLTFSGISLANGSTSRYYIILDGARRADHNGQLGHGDLEDCDEPKLIEALAGIKVIQISTGGWHSAVVTEQGDLYTWGWNNQNQLSHPSVENVVALPKIVDFTDDSEQVIDVNVKKAQCGSVFTICMTDAGELWGCGSNKYGQLGLSSKECTAVPKFVILNFDKSIRDFKCREWGTCIYT